MYSRIHAPNILKLVSYSKSTQKTQKIPTFLLGAWTEPFFHIENTAKKSTFQGEFLCLFHFCYILHSDLFILLFASQSHRVVWVGRSHYDHLVPTPQQARICTAGALQKINIMPFWRIFITVMRLLSLLFDDIPFYLMTFPFCLMTLACDQWVCCSAVRHCYLSNKFHCSCKPAFHSS